MNFFLKKKGVYSAVNNQKREALITNVGVTLLNYIAIRPNLNKWKNQDGKQQYNYNR